MEEAVDIRIETTSPPVNYILRPLIYSSWILGVGVARPRKLSKVLTIILRVLHFGICSVIVAYGAIDFFTFGSVFKSDIFKIMYYMNKVVCYVASYYYVFHGIRHYDKWPELMRRIDDLDRKIRREITINDRSIKNVQILVIVATVVLGPFSLIAHALYYYFTRPDDIFASDLLLYYTIAQSSINGFVFDVIVYVISRRFRRVNKILERLDENLSPMLIALKIRRVRELHSDICDLVNSMNDVHGIQLLLSSANSFTMVVATLFRIYMGVVEKNYAFMFINNIIWMIYAGQFAIICWVCTMASQEAGKTGTIIHSIFLSYRKTATADKMSSLRGSIRDTREISLRANEDQRNERQAENDALENIYIERDRILRTHFERDCVRNEVNDFSSQLQQHKVAFTACEFFEMNNSLLTGFVGVITTYLIILVQFYRPEMRFNRR